jgi:hypothetical protein
MIIISRSIFTGKNNNAAAKKKKEDIIRFMIHAVLSRLEFKQKKKRRPRLLNRPYFRL